jgi:hypothetical protein
MEKIFYRIVVYRKSSLIDFLSIVEFYYDETAENISKIVESKFGKDVEWQSCPNSIKVVE